MIDCLPIVNNPVQGVQGVQGAFWPTLHSYRPRHARLYAMLCRVCRVHTRGRARKIFFISTITNSLSRDNYPAHPAHPAQPAPFVFYSCAGSIFTPCTPCTLYFLLKNIMKITCGKENVDAFRAEIKAVAPGFYNLAKDLYASGMISGLRGATLETGALSDSPAIEQKAIEQSTTCRQCSHWQRDAIGDGIGIGQCLLNVHPGLVKWPGRESCNKYQPEGAL